MSAHSDFRQPKVFSITAEDAWDESPRLVSAQLSIVENDPGDIFHLRFTLSCGPTYAAGIDANYQVNLKQCEVQIETKDCEVDLRDLYTYSLSPKEIKESVKMRHYSKHKKKKSAFADLKSFLPLSSRIGVNCDFRADMIDENGVDESSSIDITQAVKLIDFETGGWIVGDEVFGDPRNRGRCLKGRYFHEKPEDPLCKIKSNGSTSELSIKLTILARLGQLDVRLLDGLGRPKFEATSKDVLDYSAALRAKLRGIVVGKAIAEELGRVGHLLDPGEFVLLKKTVVLKNCDIED